MIRFFIILLAVGLCIGVGGFVAERMYQLHLPSFFLPTLILLVFGTGLLYKYLYNVSRDLFVQLYLLSIAVKILAYGAYLVIVILEDKPGAYANVGFFMVLYLIMTVLEIWSLYQKIARS